jgi:AcrR family transcriptional regulator
MFDLESIHANVCLKRSFESEMPSDPDTSAKLAIFEAAQRLFAKEGFEKVSMRALTQEAGVNLAGVNYHFGSKQGLIDAVTTGFVNPVNEARLALLDKAEAGADGALPLETILDCFMRPVLEAVGKSDMAEQLFFQLMGRCMNERCHCISKWSHVFPKRSGAPCRVYRRKRSFGGFTSRWAC